MSTHSAGPSAHRTIIIPEGTLDGEQTNVIYIPPALQNMTTPLYVKRKSNKMLTAYSLPLWDDQWSSSDPGGSSYLEAGARGCPAGEESYFYDSLEEAEPRSPKEEGVGTSTATFQRGCAPITNATYGGPPQQNVHIYHASGARFDLSDDPFATSSSYEVAGGIEQDSLELVKVQKGKMDNPPEDYEYFSPDFQSSQINPTEVGECPSNCAREVELEDPTEYFSAEDSAGYFDVQFSESAFQPEPDYKGPTGRFNIISEMTPSPPGKSRYRSARDASFGSTAEDSSCSSVTDPSAGSCSGSYGGFCPGECSTMNRSRPAIAPAPTNATFAGRAPANATFAGPARPARPQWPYANSPALATYGGEDMSFGTSFASSRSGRGANQTFAGVGGGCCGGKANRTM